MQGIIRVLGPELGELEDLNFSSASQSCDGISSVAEKPVNPLTAQQAVCFELAMEIPLKVLQCTCTKKNMQELLQRHGSELHLGLRCAFCSRKQEWWASHKTSL